MGLLKALNLPPPRWGSQPPFPISLVLFKPAPFEPGSEQRLKLSAMLSDGSMADFTSKVTWSSSDDTLVEVRAGGFVKVGFGAGKVTITATAPGGKPRLSIDVKVQAALQAIEVTPANPLLVIGDDSETMVATGVYADGSREDLRFDVKWSSDNPNVADFPGRGNGCAGIAKGTATVWATSPDGQVSGFTKVTVVAPGKAPALREIKIEPLNPEIKDGSPVQFKAIGVYADKSTHEITGKVDWMSSRPAILVVDGGLARPRLESGSSVISASDPLTKRYAGTTTYVDFPGIHSITVSPKDFSIRVGDSPEVVVEAILHRAGRMNLNDQVRFTPDDSGVAVVTSQGEAIVGIGEGETTIEVFEASTGWTDTIAVTVLPAELVDVVVEPSGQTIRVGQTQLFTASGKLSDGTLVPLARPTWSSSSPDLIDVDPSGVATAKAPGIVFIRAVDLDTGFMGSVEVKAAP